MKPKRFAGVALLLGLAAGGLIGASLSQAWQASNRAPTDAPPTQGKPKEQPPSWLTGTADEKFAQIEKHLRGLDVAMAEIGYRYGELIVASKSRNWEYAQYQAEKIDLALRLALERRPKRVKSAQPFVNDDLPRVLDAIKKRDGQQLDQAMVRLHDSCVQCHKSENVLYFKDSVERIRDCAGR
jgi:hypothetical protein